MSASPRSALLLIDLDLQFSQLLPKTFFHRLHQPVMSRIGVDQDHQIVGKTRVLDVGVLAGARRKILRDVHEDARDATRALMGTPEFAKSPNERKKVEMRFAHLKTHHGFERMRLRGFSGARDEFHLAAIVQNLKTLANHIWRPLLNTPTACLA
jgi:hypothetical protein